LYDLVGGIPDAAYAVATRLREEGLAENFADLLEGKTVKHSRHRLELLQSR